MPQSGRPDEQHDFEDNLKQEQVDKETDKALEGRLALILVSFHHLKSKFAALTQKIEEKGRCNVTEIKVLEISNTLDQIGKLEHEINTWNQDVFPLIGRLKKIAENKNQVEGKNLTPNF